MHYCYEVISLSPLFFFFSFFFIVTPFFSPISEEIFAPAIQKLSKTFSFFFFLPFFPFSSPGSVFFLSFFSPSFFRRVLLINEGYGCKSSLFPFFFPFFRFGLPSFFLPPSPCLSSVPRSPLFFFFDAELLAGFFPPFSFFTRFPVGKFFFSSF